MKLGSGIVAAVGVPGLCPGGLAVARQPAQIEAHMRFQIPAVGHYALVRATLPYTLGPGVRFPRRIVKLSADTRRLPKGIVVLVATNDGGRSLPRRLSFTIVGKRLT